MGLSPKLSRLPPRTPSPTAPRDGRKEIRYPPTLESTTIMSTILFDDEEEEINTRRALEHTLDCSPLMRTRMRPLSAMSRSSSSNSTVTEVMEVMEAGMIKQGGSKRRWRAILIGVVVIATVLVLTPASNRRHVHTVLTSAGVPLPDRIMPDRLHDFLEAWGTPADGSGDLPYVPYPDDDQENDGAAQSTTDQSETHTFNANGHFIITPPHEPPVTPSRHPISILIKRAQRQWNAKVARQSRTLNEAVKEYRRRYTRNPPKGFDQWWTYVQANRVVLTDEYDQIHRDLEPFWALFVIFVPFAVDNARN